MRRSAITLAICFAALLLPAAAGVAAPSGPNSGTLVVNTVFDPAMASPVVEATGAFTGCTSVTDLDSDIKFPPGTAVFSGTKQINCDDGTITVSYTATAEKMLGGTHGSWRVIGGTGDYAGSTGGGRLTGDSSACDPMGAEGCILDTFAGNLS
jgi:hypothetical protein